MSPQKATAATDYTFYNGLYMGQNPLLGYLSFDIAILAYWIWYIFWKINRKKIVNG